ncbi:unnamed protein product [Caenorhabditis sp. 36 PRJEB53466]|nr:unnamed protein product [Caenorhabditis sp. 36 PRJEB53466]CAI2356332.1 unnamed protein product [Caenorhabditis sp. 36 PRJEB53466]
MFGLKETLFFSLLLVCIAEGAKRNAQCDQVCQRKMTIECCECIGCHQGMRFGKRSQPFNSPEFEEAALTAHNEDMSGIEEAIAEIEMELANRSPRRFGQKYNH